ncbi:MAG: hypothetical protein WDN04_00030 [Rhodospirillales bacterium]
MSDGHNELEGSVRSLLDTLKVMASQIGNDFQADPEKVKVFAEAFEEVKKAVPEGAIYR